jgi:hypothetical protein
VHFQNCNTGAECSDRYLRRKRFVKEQCPCHQPDIYGNGGLLNRMCFTLVIYRF